MSKLAYIVSCGRITSIAMNGAIVREKGGMCRAVFAPGEHSSAWSEFANRKEAVMFCANLGFRTVRVDPQLGQWIDWIRNTYASTSAIAVINA